MIKYLLCLTALLTGSVSWAQSVQRPDEDVSVAAELASFQVSEGFEVQPFADETNGIANPISIRWDAAGRLWVLCTWAYPQLKPDEVANDTVENVGLFDLR